MGLSYLNNDTISFKNTIPSGGIIKRAYLIFPRLVFIVGNSPSYDSPRLFSFNGSSILLDSSSVISESPFTFDYSIPSGESWLSAIDVTNYALMSGNYLITTNQSFQNDPNYPSYGFVYYSFYLIIIYENPIYAECNVCVLINNKNMTTNFTEAFKVLNPINNNYDVGLSIWLSSEQKSLQDPHPTYSLNSTSGNFNIGSLNSTSSNGNDKHDSLPGSFNYFNNTLNGLVDDTPDALIDSTDALADISGYLPNSCTSFTLNSTAFTHPGGANIRLGNFLAYSTPCAAYGGVDQSSDTAICKWQSVNLSAYNCNNCTYAWFPSAGLSDTTSANVIANPLSTTNYICTITDSVGCHFTEHHRVQIHQQAAPDTMLITAARCGGNGGTLTIDAAYYNYHPFTYYIDGQAHNDTIIQNIAGGNHLLQISDNIGCTYTVNFNIPEVNPVNANFTSVPAQGVYSELQLYLSKPRHL